MMLKDKRILLGVSGGIAAYKAAELCSLLKKRGAKVRVVMTRNAAEFVAPLTFETLTQSPVYLDMFAPPRSYEMEHIAWARWGQVLLVAPATADILAKMAAGIADDALTTLYLSFSGPVIVAPAMNTQMLEHPATKANLATLAARGVQIVPPGSGLLACGEHGPGRLAEPAVIVEQVEKFLEGMETTSGSGQHSQQVGLAKDVESAAAAKPRDNALAGKVVVITSGPTHEYIDPVRFLTNPSSGKMGAALARAAATRGATVHLVTGPVSPAILPTDCATIHRVTTAEQMLLAVQALADSADAFIFAAAVSDFRVARPVEKKIKRTGNSLNLPLVENPDIAQAIGSRKKTNQVSIGFAAETDNLEANAVGKLQRKRLDAIVANDVTNPRIGFESDDNEVTIYLQDGSKLFISRRPKDDVAQAVVDVLIELLRAKSAKPA
ncbi:MAG: bifunctional phosphopantothenoylcysteine decarboxylase/phosphopantothenate synthase [Candidatus Sumerlaeaceae bacterium]